MTTTSNAGHMTRAEARKIGKEMQRAGFQFVSLVEDLDTGACSVRAVNRAWMDRTITTLGDWLDLKGREGRR